MKMTPRRPGRCPPTRHTWSFACKLMLHLPTAEGVPGIIIRACSACGLAEVGHVLHVPGRVKLYTWEQWTVEETRPGWHETRTLWDKTKEQLSR